MIFNTVILLLQARSHINATFPIQAWRSCFNSLTETICPIVWVTTWWQLTAYDGVNVINYIKQIKQLCLLN